MVKRIKFVGNVELTSELADRFRIDLSNPDKNVCLDILYAMTEILNISEFDVYLDLTEVKED